MNSLSEIRSFGERFRNILYLVVSVSIGYLILVKFLSIMDAESIGLNWLADNPNNAFVVIFVIWLFLILAVDLIIDLIYSKSREKAVRIPQVAEEKPVPTEGEKIAELIGEIEEAPSGPAETKWPYFLGKPETKSTPSKSQEEAKRVNLAQKGRKTRTKQKKEEAPEEKEEVKTEALGSKPLEPAKKRRKKTKDKVAGTEAAEEPKIKRETASNIQSTDTAGISLRKGRRFKEAFDGEHHVSIIDFIPGISRKKTMIRIERLKATSNLVDEIPPNIIFENFNIWVNMPEKNIGKPVIAFKVDQGWVDENRLREIQLYKYIAGEWVLQGPTEKLDEDGEHFYFGTQALGLTGSYAIVGKTAAIDSRQKTASIQAPEIKEAQISGLKKKIWPIFWRKQDKAIPSRPPEDKEIVKREVLPQKEEPKTEAPKKEAKPEIKPLEPAEKILEAETAKVKAVKGKVERTKTVEGSKQEIREPADNIQSTDTAAISVKRGSRFREAFDDEHHVSVIDFTPNISRKKTMIRVEKLKATSHLIEEIPPNIVFENFNIWVNIPEKNIGKPGIVFRVDRSWITENNLREIRLYMYMDHEWVLQGPTEKLDEDGEHFYFQTPLKGLSGSYAIVGI